MHVVHELSSAFVARGRRARTYQQAMEDNQRGVLGLSMRAFVRAVLLHRVTE